MDKDATVIDGPPAIQYFQSNGGWPEGDETFNGPSRPTDAFITYYQKRRHIFGDLKIEIFDQDGKLLDTIAGSKHRGLNRLPGGCGSSRPWFLPRQRCFSRPHKVPE